MIKYLAPTFCWKRSAQRSRTYPFEWFLTYSRGITSRYGTLFWADPPVPPPFVAVVLPWVCAGSSAAVCYNYYDYDDPCAASGVSVVGSLLLFEFEFEFYVSPSVAIAMFTDGNGRLWPWSSAYPSSSLILSSGADVVMIICVVAMRGVCGWFVYFSCHAFITVT